MNVILEKMIDIFCIIELQNDLKMISWPVIITIRYLIDTSPLKTLQ